MGKFTDLRNVRCSVILDGDRERYSNLVELERIKWINDNISAGIENMKEEMEVTEVKEEITEDENDPPEEAGVESGVGEGEEPLGNKRRKFSTIRIRLTDVFEMLQRPKRKPLREFFIDEEEELESESCSFTPCLLNTEPGEASKHSTCIDLSSTCSLAKIWKRK